MKIIGADIKSGEYQGNKYCNVMLYGTYPVTSGNGIGDATRHEKVKYEVFCKNMGVKDVTTDVLFSLIGEEFEFGYDRYQNVSYIHRLQPEPATE